MSNNPDDASELYFCSTLEPDQFWLLYCIYLASGKINDVSVSYREIGGNFSREMVYDLVRSGHIRFPMDIGARGGCSLTQRGLDEIEFTIKKTHRRQLLKKIYGLTGGDTSKVINAKELAELMKLEINSVKIDLKHLIGLGFLRIFAATMNGGLGVQINSAGIASIEGAKDKFSFGSQIVVNGDIRTNSDNLNTSGANSPIQSRSSNSNQSISISTNDLAQIAALIPLLRSDLPKLELDNLEIRDIEAQLKTIEGQLESSKPKPSIIHEALSTVWDSVKKKATEKGGEMVFTWLTHLPMILAITSHFPQ